jgi:hypothetical protein
MTLSLIVVIESDFAFGIAACRADEQVKATCSGSSDGVRESRSFAERPQLAPPADPMPPVECPLADIENRCDACLPASR